MNNRFCQKCGNPLAENERFCGKCGTPAEAAPAPAPAPEQAAPVQDMQATIYAGAEAAQEAQQAADQAQTFANDAAQAAQQTADQAAAFANGNAAPFDPAAVQGAVPAKKGPGAAAVIAKYKLPIIIAAIVLVLGIAGFIIFKQLTKYEKIDSKDLFAVNFSGLNGQGTAVAYLNCEEAVPAYIRYSDDFDEEEQEYSDYFSDEKKALLKAYKKAGSKSDATKMRKALLKQKNDKYVLKLKLSQDKELSNGDKITCTVDYDEDELKEANIKLENTEFEVEVEGLIEAEELDLFEGFAPKFSGVDESGEMTYDSTNATYPFITYYSYSGSGLKNGDIVNITAEIDTSKIENKQEVYGAPEGDEDDEDEDDEDDDEDDDDNVDVYTRKFVGFTFDYDGKTYLVKETYQSKDFTVSGLSEPDEIDIFANVKVVFNGADPYLYYDSISTENCDSVIKDNVSFYRADYDQDSFKIGDTIKIQASIYESDLKRAGFKPSNLKDTDGYYYFDYTITEEDAAGHYILDDASADDHKKLDEAEGSFNDLIKEVREDSIDSWYIGSVQFGDGITKLSEAEPYKAYLLKCKGFDEGTIESYNNKTFIVKVYKMTATYEDDDKSKEKTFYLAVRVSDAIIDGEGNAVIGEYSSNTTADTKLADVVDQVLNGAEGERIELKTF